MENVVLNCGPTLSLNTYLLYLNMYEDSRCAAYPTHCTAESDYRNFSRVLCYIGEAKKNRRVSAESINILRHQRLRSYLLRSHLFVKDLSYWSAPTVCRGKRTE